MQFFRRRDCCQTKQAQQRPADLLLLQVGSQSRAANKQQPSFKDVSTELRQQLTRFK